MEEVGTLGGEEEVSTQYINGGGGGCTVIHCHQCYRCQRTINRFAGQERVALL